MTMTAEVDEATYRAWRVRKTVWEMLKCRGYEVNDEDMNMTVTTFMERYGQDKDYHNQTWLSEREGESIMVFFPKSTKVGVKTCIRYLDLMKNGNVTRGIMVLPQTLSPFAKQGLLEMKGYHLECFTEEELMYNVTKHEMVPPHTIMNPEQVAQILKRYRITEKQLPKIDRHDAVARFMGLRVGDIVQIIRPSETAGRYVTYRLVM